MVVIIRTHPLRENEAKQISTQVPNSILLVDNKADAMGNFLAALKMSFNDNSLHLEDDVILTSNFNSKSKEVINLHPNNVIQFFSMRKDDKIIGSRFINGAKFMMNQCFYLPLGYSELIYNYYSIWDKKHIHPSGYDILMADFLKSRKEKYYNHVPSLVQHKICKSLINPKRSSKRQSLTFVP